MHTKYEKPVVKPWLTGCDSGSASQEEPRPPASASLGTTMTAAKLAVAQLAWNAVP